MTCLPTAYGVRILTAPDADAVARELARTGCAPEDVYALASHGVWLLVRLERATIAVAQQLRRAMRDAGGEAAIPCAADAGGVVLLGTEAQVRQAAARLAPDPALAAIASAIMKTMRCYDARGGELRCGPYRLPLGAKTWVMGILNVTPDSFSGDGIGGDIDAALRQAEQMLTEGADLLDVGGESTRPGAREVPVAEELRRVTPVVQALATRFPVPISVDTYKSEVARAALDTGATLVNDISGLRFDPAMARTAAEYHAAVVVMHIQGTPRTMQLHPHYDDLMTEICASLQESTALAMAAGIPPEQVVLDPGFGFGKTLENNLELLRRLRELRSFGQPVLIGTSRKSSIGKILGDLPPEERVEGTAATVALAIAHGADIVRVHDVKAMARVAKVADAVERNYAE